MSCVGVGMRVSLPPMSELRWKKAERKLAALVGGKRKPVDGSRAGIDVETPLFGYQLKSRSDLPAWLGEWLDGIVGRAEQEGKVGVLVLHRPGQEMRGTAIAVVRLADWVALHGDGAALGVGDE